LRAKFLRADATAGLTLLFLAGAMNGSFSVPTKFMGRWRWENIWLLWTVFALVLFPPILTVLTVPKLGEIYAQVDKNVLLTVAGFGAGWGFSQIFLGLAVDQLGVGLAISIILGLSAAVGSLVPLIRLHPEKLATPGGMVVIGGIALVLFGVSLCALAGRQREGLRNGIEGKAATLKGLFFCLISGVGSALVNFGLAFGSPLLEAAEKLGVPKIWTPNTVWLLLMCAGAAPNLLYCSYLMRRNRSLARFWDPATTSYWILAAVMAVCWFGSTVLYGVCTTKLGSLGTVLAWPVFMSLIVITASAWGVGTGEWKAAGRRPLATMIAGVSILVIAVFVLSVASQRI
jgi:L-rhamnose-H+ transport protein